jgi:hypothetical protein
MTPTVLDAFRWYTILEILKIDPNLITDARRVCGGEYGLNLGNSLRLHGKPVRIDLFSH